MSEEHPALHLPPPVRPRLSQDAGFLRRCSPSNASTSRRPPACSSNSWKPATPADRPVIRQDEHEADRIKIRNLHTLNEAFSTPIDREDLYRAIIDLDEIVNYCKTTVSEMDVLGLAPDKHCLEMAMHIKLGTDALAPGLSRLAKEPASSPPPMPTPRARPSARSKRPTAAPSPNYSRRRLHPHVQAPRNLPPPVQRRRPHGQLRQHAARHRRQDVLNPARPVGAEDDGLLDVAGP
jgi:hypothetical protein